MSPAPGSHAVVRPAEDVSDGGGPFARFTTYPRGSLRAVPDGPSGGGRTVGCLDVRVERVRDPEAAPSAVTLSFRIGNRCKRPLEVAFQRIRVTDYDADGRETVLRRHDPAREVRTRTLDGRARAREIVEYDRPPSAAGTPVRACADLSDVVEGGPSPPTSPVCFTAEAGTVAHEDVVGHRTRSVFGEAWHARPFAFFAELSASERTLGLSDLSFTGKLPDGRRFGVPGDSLGRVNTYGVVDHFELRLLGPLYAGFLLRVGGGHLAPRAPFLGGRVPASTGTTIEELAAGGAVGLLSRPLGNARIRADVAVGGSVVLLDVDVPGCGSPCGSASADAGRFWVEPRIVLDAWLTPFWTVSAWASADALRLPDLAVGLALGFHVRTFDAFP